MYILTKWHASNIFFWLSRSNHLKITLSFHIYRNYLSLDLCANIQRLRKINFYSMLSYFFWLVTFALPAISAVAVVNAFILIMLLIRVFQNKWSEAPCIFCHSGMTPTFYTSWKNRKVQLGAQAQKRTIFVPNNLNISLKLESIAYSRLQAVIIRYIVHEVVNGVTS